MALRLCIILSILLIFPALLNAQGRNGHSRHPSPMDSVLSAPTDYRHDALTEIDHEMEARNQRFYDSLRAKTHRSGFAKFLYKAVIKRHQRDTTRSGRFIDEAKTIRQYAGKTIGQIDIERREVFDEDGNWLERLSNKVHVVTLESTIRKDILFNTGDKFDPQLMVRNAQLLRDRKYISNVVMDYQLDEADSTVVNVTVKTLDSWTIGVDASANSKGKAMVKLYDANILGSGDRLSVQTYFDWKTGDYSGNIVEFDDPNILGSFYRGHFQVGKGWKKSIKSVDISKEFLLKTDYMLGVDLTDNRDELFYLLYKDTTDLVASKRYEAWAGYSMYLDRHRSSLYFSSGYTRENFYKRPEETNVNFNHGLHDYHRALGAIGLYREKFYTATLIYGFGFKEYVAAGYKAELVGGYSWGEFRNDIYMGANYKFGGFSRIGYFMSGFNVGSYFDPHKREWWRSTLDVEVRWFSPLFIIGRKSRLRQFLSLNYTQGWNRGRGYEELLTFTKTEGPRSIREHVAGRNRIVINTESVLFTPLQPIGFRVATFGFADFAFLGNKTNPFRNDFYTTFGIGLRLRNERLVFSTIQFRFGVAFGKNGMVKNQMFNLSNEQRMTRTRFLPSAPEVTGYK